MEAMLNTSTLIGVGAVLTVVVIGQSYLLWRLTRSLGGVQKLDEKLGHYGDALSLLTETTESGFKAVAAELDRTAARPNDGPAKAAIKKAMPGPSTAARISAAARKGQTVPENLDVILDIDLPLSVRFGHAELTLDALTKLGPGSLIELARMPDDPVELLVNGKLVARGEVVVVGGNYGVRVHEVVSAQERIRTLE
jgi:flagellar motor switch protein FliN